MYEFHQRFKKFYRGSENFSGFYKVQGSSEGALRWFRTVSGCFSEGLRKGFQKAMRCFLRSFRVVPDDFKKGCLEPTVCSGRIQ